MVVDARDGRMPSTSAGRSPLARSDDRLSVLCKVRYGRSCDRADLLFLRFRRLNEAGGIVGVGVVVERQVGDELVAERRRREAAEVDAGIGQFARQALTFAGFVRSLDAQGSHVGG